MPDHLIIDASRQQLQPGLRVNPAPAAEARPADEGLAKKPLWRRMHEANRQELADNPHAELAECYEAMIRAVADWLEARGNRGSAAELHKEADRG